MEKPQSFGQQPGVAIQTLKTLGDAIQVENVTKESINTFAEIVSKRINDPLLATLKLKPIIEFAKALNEELKTDAISLAKQKPQSKRRLGSIIYDVVNRRTYDYGDDPTLIELKEKVKQREKYLQREGRFTDAKETEYLKVTIPKT